MLQNFCIQIAQLQTYKHHIYAFLQADQHTARLIDRKPTTHKLNYIKIENRGQKFSNNL